MKPPQLTGNVKLYREAMRLVKRANAILDQIERKWARQEREQRAKASAWEARQKRIDSAGYRIID